MSEYVAQEHLCSHIKYHYSSSDLACTGIGADCQHVFAGLEKLLGAVINIILIPCTGDTSPLGLGFHIYTQTRSCVNTHTQYTHKYKHTYTLAAYVGLVFITQTPQWDWGWPVTESRWTPSSLSALSCISWPLHHSLSYPSIFTWSLPFTWPQGNTSGWQFII